MMRTNEICKKTKLTRQSNDTFITGLQITKSEALDDIYHCFDMWMMMEAPEEGEIIEETVTYWGNEFMFRDATEGQGVFHLVEDDSVYSVGIDEFREKTHVVFKEMSFGVMWKILPLMGQRKLTLSEIKTCYIGQFDGCFTRNFDGIMDKMNIVDQIELFGTFLDINIENRSYLLWTALI